MILIGNLDLGHFIDTQNYLTTSTPKSWSLDNLLLDHVGLPHVLILAGNFLGWMGRGDHPKTFLLLVLFC